MFCACRCRKRLCRFVLICHSCWMHLGMYEILQIPNTCASLPDYGSQSKKHDLSRDDEGSYFDNQLALMVSAPRVSSLLSQRLCGRPPWYFLLRCYHVLSSVPPLVHQSTSESLPEFPVRSSDTIRVPVGGFYQGIAACMTHIEKLRCEKSQCAQKSIDTRGCMT